MFSKQKKKKKRNAAAFPPCGRSFNLNKYGKTRPKIMRVSRSENYVTNNPKVAVKINYSNGYKL